MKSNTRAAVFPILEFYTKYCSLNHTPDSNELLTVINDHLNNLNISSTDSGIIFTKDSSIGIIWFTKTGLLQLKSAESIKNPKNMLTHVSKISKLHHSISINPTGSNDSTGKLKLLINSVETFHSSLYLLNYPLPCATSPKQSPITYFPTIISWINQILLTSFPCHSTNLIFVLRSGTTLCQIITALFPSTTCKLLSKDAKYSIHRILFFLDFSRSVGVKASEIFLLADLFPELSQDQEKSTINIIKNIKALEVIATNGGWNGPKLDTTSMDLQTNQEQEYRDGSTSSNQTLTQPETFLFQDTQKTFTQAPVGNSVPLNNNYQSFQVNSLSLPSPPKISPHQQNNLKPHRKPRKSSFMGTVIENESIQTANWDQMQVNIKPSKSFDIFESYVDGLPPSKYLHVVPTYRRPSQDSSYISDTTSVVPFPELEEIILPEVESSNWVDEEFDDLKNEKPKLTKRSAISPIQSANKSEIMENNYARANYNAPNNETLKKRRSIVLKKASPISKKSVFKNFFSSLLLNRRKSTPTEQPINDKSSVSNCQIKNSNSTKDFIPKIISSSELKIRKRNQIIDKLINDEENFTHNLSSVLDYLTSMAARRRNIAKSKNGVFKFEDLLAKRTFSETDINFETRMNIEADEISTLCKVISHILDLNNQFLENMELLLNASTESLKDILFGDLLLLHVQSITRPLISYSVLVLLGHRYFPENFLNLTDNEGIEFTVGVVSKFIGKRFTRHREILDNNQSEEFLPPAPKEWDWYLYRPVRRLPEIVQTLDKILKFDTEENQKDNRKIKIAKLKLNACSVAIEERIKS